MFEPEIHTKEFLLLNPLILKELAEKSPKFALSELASDFDLLMTEHEVNNQDEVVTLGHLLAKYQSAWLNNQACEKIEILSLKDSNGRSVAHELATSQSAWAKSPRSKDIEVLSLVAEFSEETVAGTLAVNNCSWVSSLTLDDFELLKLPTHDNDHTTVAEEIVDSSFFSVCEDILNSEQFLKIETEIGWGSTKTVSTLAHKIAAMDNALPKVFMMMQETEILTLVDSYGVSVAHILAENQTEWAASPAAKRDEILKLTTPAGSRVSHKLAIYQGKNCPKEVWNPEYLTQVRNAGNWLNISLAHDLASNNSDWVAGSEDAFKKEVLLMTCHYAPDPTFKVSVAEYLNGFKISEIIARVLNAGGCFKIYNPSSTTAKISPVDIEEIEHITTEIIETHTEPFIKLKLCISLYSTLVNLRDIVLDIPQNLKIKGDGALKTLDLCNNLISQRMRDIEQIIQANPDFLGHREILLDVNCEPGELLLNQIESKLTLVFTDPNSLDFLSENVEMKPLY